jgi:uncharacterized membrane protein
MLGNRQKNRLAGTVVVFMVLVMIAEAVSALMRGELMYRNAYGLQVFAPFAILIGVLGLVLLAVVVGQALRSDRRDKRR